MGTTLLDPRTRMYRYLVLFVVSILPFGSYFAYDSVGAIAPLLTGEVAMSREAIGSSYTIYSIAAIIALLGAGFMIDRMGTRKSSLIFSLVVLVGAVIVAWVPDLRALMPGRAVFGAGAEPLIVVQSAILARWFKGKELAFSFGFALAISRLGTLFSFNLGELIAEQYNGYPATLWAAAIFCAVSLVACVIYALLDLRGEKVLELEETGADDKIKISDIKHFPASFWYVTALCVTFYSAIFPFTALATDFFADKWGVPGVAEATGGFFAKAVNNYLHMFSTAGGLTSIIIFASMICAPFAGGLVDRFGKRASIMIWGSLALIPAHLVMGLTHFYPAIPMIVLGVAFVLVPAAMWPSVPLVVKKAHVGTAFGLMTLIQNFGLAAFPWFNGKLRDVTQDYTASMIMFAALGVVGLVFAILLKRADKREGGILEAAG